MISKNPSRSNNIWLWCLLTASALSALYLAFISVLCIRTGLLNLPQSGFWVPLLSGTMLLAAVLCLFLRAAKLILRHMKPGRLINL